MWEIKSKYVQVISKADWWHSPCGELLCTCPLFEIVNLSSLWGTSDCDVRIFRGGSLSFYPEKYGAIHLVTMQKPVMCLIWNCLLCRLDIDKCWTRWHNTFYSVISECVPKKILPSKNSSFGSVKYKLCRNRIATELRKAKFYYFKKMQTSDPNFRSKNLLETDKI